MDQPFDFSNIGAMLQQLGAMMQRAENLPEGAVDWDAARQTARALIAKDGDPSVVGSETERVRAAAELAHLWLDGVTDLPAPSLATAAWSRSEWLEATFAGWQQLLEPIAQSMQRSVTETAQGQHLPEEMAALVGPMLDFASRMSAVMVSQQLGQALGTLARDAWSTSDIGVPLTAPGTTALVTANTRAFAHELSIDGRDFETYLAIREAAAQRLFKAAPWIGPRIRDAVAAYAAEVRVDTERLQELVGDIDVSNPMALQQAMASGSLELPLTAGQTAALARVEVLIALIEGWIDHVTELAHGGRIGSAVAIREALRRRRATGGPSERTFAQLLGLELRPRRMREAAAFWAAQEPAERDSLWAHPDFLPDALEAPPAEE